MNKKEKEAILDDLKFYTDFTSKLHDRICDLERKMKAFERLQNKKRKTRRKKK